MEPKKDDRAVPPTELGTTTILSAYPTDFLVNECPYEQLSGDLSSINLGGTHGTLSLDIQKHVLSFRTDKDELIIDAKLLFAINFTAKTFQPITASLSESPQFMVPLNAVTTEVNFTLFYYQGSDKLKRFAAHSFQAQDTAIARKWVVGLRDYIRPPKRSKTPNLFFVSNPFGGGKKAPKLFESITKPMLQLAEINYDLFETQYFQHGIELAQTTPNLSMYDAIVSVGGDGVFHEVVNGALTRKDWKEVVNVPFGVLPAGSANGVAVTLGFSEFHLASLSLIRGNTQKYDIAALYCTNKGDEVTYSVLDAVNGYFSDVDDTADKFRWMGPMRLTVAAIVRSIFLKKYRTRVYYLPDDTNIANCVVRKDKESHAGLDAESKEKVTKPGPRPSIPNVVKGYNCVTDPIGERLTESWKTVDGAFGVTAITNVSFLTKDFRISGTASTSNGTMSLVHDNKRLSGFGFLDTLLKETSDPTKGTFVSSMKETLAHCVIIESLGLIVKDKPVNPKSKPSLHSQIIENRLVSWNPTAPGTFRVDGEVLKETTAIQVQILPGLLNLICPNWL